MPCEAPYLAPPSPPSPSPVSLLGGGVTARTPVLTLYSSCLHSLSRWYHQLFPITQICIKLWKHRFPVCKFVCLLLDFKNFLKGLSVIRDAVICLYRAHDSFRSTFMP